MAKRLRDDLLSGGTWNSEASLFFEPEKKLSNIGGHLQELLLQQKEPPTIPDGYQYGKPAWLTPLLSKVTFTARGFLHEWGIDSLLVFGKHYDQMVVHWGAIAALTEIWNPQTNTFVFPSFEATILLEEVDLFLGLKRNKVGTSSVAHSVDRPTALDFMSKLTGDRLQARNIVNPAGIRLSCLAKWTMKAKDDKVDDEKIAQALSLCLAGLFFFPSRDDFLDEEFLGVMQSVWRGNSPTQAILAHLYCGLTLASLGKPLHGSVLLLDIWIHFHLKMDFCTDDEADSRTRRYDRSPIYRVSSGLGFTDRMVIKTLDICSRIEWRKFLRELPVAEFMFFSEALSKLKFKVRPCEGVDLRLVGGEELVLYNAHRCYLQLGQPRHVIPRLSYYPPIALRKFGTYSDQVDVRSCIELWKISKPRQAKFIVPEELELVKAYVTWIKLAKLSG